MSFEIKYKSHSNSMFWFPFPVGKNPSAVQPIPLSQPKIRQIPVPFYPLLTKLKQVAIKLLKAILIQ